MSDARIETNREDRYDCDICRVKAFVRVQVCKRRGSGEYVQVTLRFCKACSSIIGNMILYGQNERMIGR